MAPLRRTATSVARGTVRYPACSLALRNLRLRRCASLPLVVEQPVGDVVLVDVADVGHRFAANPLRGNALEVAEPDVRIEASLLRFSPELSDASRPGVRPQTSSGPC